VRPTFGVVDALQNLHRLDASLLEGLMTQCKGGVQLLAGPQQPQNQNPTAAELARLFDLLVAHFRYVVVDCSGRLDQTARQLCDLPTPSLRSHRPMWFRCGAPAGFAISGRERNPGPGSHRAQPLQKIPGFTDEDVEKATTCKLLWKVPNNFQSVAPAIDKGSAGGARKQRDRPLISIAGRDAGAGLANQRGFYGFVIPERPRRRLIQKATGRLLISPLRANQ